MPVVIKRWHLDVVSAYKRTDKASELGVASIYASRRVMDEFHALIAQTQLMGLEFDNPYTGGKEKFPETAEQFTARHLHLLARPEQENTTGMMELLRHYLPYKLVDDENGNRHGEVDMLEDDYHQTSNWIAALRCLVKNTVGGAVTTVHSQGGYGGKTPPPKTEVPERRVILIDQAGLQWQGDYRNTGGLFFYPYENSEHLEQLPSGYKEWQERTFKAMYGFDRPQVPIKKILVVWDVEVSRHGDVDRAKPVSGVLDLDSLTLAFAVEFRQALDAVVAQGVQDPISFKFLKAGFGAFASGLNNWKVPVELEIARLDGILMALQAIQKLHQDPSIVLGMIKKLELPYSDSIDNNVKQCLQCINMVVTSLGLEFGRCDGVDALEKSFYYSPTDGKLYPYVDALTTCGDPHVLIGNEFPPQSVDAMITGNAFTKHMNPGANVSIECSELNDYISTASLQQRSLPRSPDGFRPFIFNCPFFQDNASPLFTRIPCSTPSVSSVVPPSEPPPSQFLAAQPHAAPADPIAISFTLSVVSAYAKKEEPPQWLNEASIYASERIMTEFHKLIAKTDLMGKPFNNPYTNQGETFPNNPEHFTARHLYILARAEASNTTGEMMMWQYLPYNQTTDAPGVYQYKLLVDNLVRDRAANLVASLRCLVKNTVGCAVTTADAKGGYYSERVKFPSPIRIIMVDQSGVQFQRDYRNTGGLFFYPDTNPENQGRLPSHYETWQQETFKAMYGFDRPIIDTHTRTIAVKWSLQDKNTYPKQYVYGNINLDAITQAFAIEFRQALDAIVAQGVTDSPINFKFLKAGLGAFSEGLDDGNVPGTLELARLGGILRVLNCIAELPLHERSFVLGAIKRLELPYSFNSYSSSSAEVATVLSNIESTVKSLGLIWGGAVAADALEQPQELWKSPGGQSYQYMTALTNCGDPHAAIGNEMYYSSEDGFNFSPRSVDAMLADNAYTKHLNAGANPKIKYVPSNDYTDAASLRLPHKKSRVGSTLRQPETSAADPKLQQSSSAQQLPEPPVGPPPPPSFFTPLPPSSAATVLIGQPQQRSSLDERFGAEPSQPTQGRNPGRHLVQQLFDGWTSRPEMTEGTKNSYIKLWNANEDVDTPPLLNRIAAVLDDYTKGYSRFSRFAHFHWNRHYVKEVNEIVQNIRSDNSEFKLPQVLDKIRDIMNKPDFNKSGSLARRVAFIGQKISEASEKSINDACPLQSLPPSLKL